MIKKQDSKSKISLDPGNTLFILYIGFVSFFVFLAMVVDGYASVSPGDVRQGELLFRDTTENERYIPAPRLSQNVEIYVSGMIARTILSQRFVNNTGSWQEAVYVFPLPDESAVDSLRMKIGERVIVGEIKEKEEAKAIYNKAKSQGQKASLLAQERPNIFSMAVANIAPGEEITVEIEFGQVVSLHDDIFSLRFPMVLTPRYIPGKALAGNEEAAVRFAGNGWSVDTDQVPDASRITPPLFELSAEKQNQVHLLLELAAGFPVASLTSLYHGITVEKEGEQKRLIRFNGEVKADRDFVLEWTAAAQKSPRAALFSEQRGEDEYHLLMLTPPTSNITVESPSPREMIFVLDTSGSMAGPSLAQAKEALILAISRLGEQDRFNVIEFNSTATKLFDGAEKGDIQHRQKAVRFVRQLEADGGTEIASALTLALDGKQSHERIRQVVFLTDGSVGNERELFSMIASQLGDSRLFTVGIGAAPNSFFMSRAAAIGRGSFTYIGKVSEVRQKMQQLFDKLEHPVLANITLQTVAGKDIEFYPNPIPDLYRGEPLLIAVKAEGAVELQLGGLINGRQWQQTVTTENGAGRPGIASLWARKKIRTVMDSRAQGAEETEIRAKVLSTALKHHLLSKYTSLVAVEQQVSRPAEEELQTTTMKTLPPAGTPVNTLFAGRAKTATASPLHIFLGLCLLLSGVYLLRRNRRGVL